MDIVFTATDMGFKVKADMGSNPGKEMEGVNRIQIDGIEFPEDIPQPIFGSATTAQYTRFRYSWFVRCSDLVEAGKSEVAKSLIPSFHTRDHCVIISSSHVPSVWLVSISDVVGFLYVEAVSGRGVDSVDV